MTLPYLCYALMLKNIHSWTYFEQCLIQLSYDSSVHMKDWSHTLKRLVLKKNDLYCLLTSFKSSIYRSVAHLHHTEGKYLKYHREHILLKVNILNLETIRSRRI